MLPTSPHKKHGPFFLIPLLILSVDWRISIVSRGPEFYYCVSKVFFFFSGRFFISSFYSRSPLSLAEPSKAPDTNFFFPDLLCSLCPSSAFFFSLLVRGPRTSGVSSPPFESRIPSDSIEDPGHWHLIAPPPAKLTTPLLSSVNFLFTVDSLQGFSPRGPALSKTKPANSFAFFSFSPFPPPLKNANRIFLFSLLCCLLHFFVPLSREASSAGFPGGGPSASFSWVLLIHGSHLLVSFLDSLSFLFFFLFLLSKLSALARGRALGRPFSARRLEAWPPPTFGIFFSSSHPLPAGIFFLRIQIFALDFPSLSVSLFPLDDTFNQAFFVRSASKNDRSFYPTSFRNRRPP